MVMVLTTLGSGGVRNLPKKWEVCRFTYWKMVASHRIKVIELFAIEIALLKYTYLNASGLSVGLNTDQVYWVNQNVDILR